MASAPEPARFHDDGTGFSMATFTQQNGTANDLFVSLSVPKHFGWGATGIGNQMRNARMFIVYPGSNAEDVTLSIRTTPGEVMPHETNDPVCEKRNAKVVDNMIQATAVCYGFGSYSGLTADAANADWIFSVGPGITIDSDNEGATLMKHQTHGNFQLDMAAAHRAAAAPSASASALPVATGGPSTASAGPQPIANYEQLITAHGAILGLCFILFFPIAVLLLRLKSTRWHYIMTTFTSVLVFIGFVIGLVQSIYGLEYAAFNQSHQILGIIVCSLILLLQLPGGAIGHMRFLKTGRPSILGTLHKYSGRILVLLGSINGILGFQLADEMTFGPVAYGVVSLLIWVFVMAFSEFWVRRQAKRRTSSETAEKKITDRSDSVKTEA